MANLALQLLDYLNTMILLYFVSANAVYTVLIALSLYAVLVYSRFSGTKAHLHIKDTPELPEIALLVPAFNEGRTVLETVKSLLSLDYPNKKIIVIDDGSTDDTLMQLRAAFNLMPVDRTYSEVIKTKQPNLFLINPAQPELLVISKPNGGKSDALNVGLNLAEADYFCSMDADSVVESDALLRLIYPVLESKVPVVVSGGVIRLLNGSRLEGGQVVEIDLPDSWLERCQTVEYLRTFFFGRPGWNTLHATFIASGAFALFRTDVVKAAGGFSSDTVTEDIDLIATLHSHLRSKGEPYRMKFTADPVCWTEAPRSIGTLGKQRRRWQLGLTQTVMKHNRQILNPRYGSFGMISMPFHAYIEALGCLFEAVGLFVVPFSLVIGAMPLNLFWLITFFAVGYGTLLSIGSVLMHELTIKRYPRMRNLMVLLLYSIIEGFGYRQLISLYRAHGVLQYFAGFSKWEVVEHTGVGTAASPVAD